MIQTQTQMKFGEFVQFVEKSAPSGETKADCGDDDAEVRIVYVEAGEPVKTVVQESKPTLEDKLWVCARCSPVTMPPFGVFENTEHIIVKRGYDRHVFYVFNPRPEFASELEVKHAWMPTPYGVDPRIILTLGTEFMPMKQESGKWILDMNIHSDILLKVGMPCIVQRKPDGSLKMIERVLDGVTMFPSRRIPLSSITFPMIVKDLCIDSYAIEMEGFSDETEVVVPIKRGFSTVKAGAPWFPCAQTHRGDVITYVSKGLRTRLGRLHVLPPDHEDEVDVSFGRFLNSVAVLEKNT